MADGNIGVEIDYLRKPTLGRMVWEGLEDYVNCRGLLVLSKGELMAAIVSSQQGILDYSTASGPEEMFEMMFGLSDMEAFAQDFVNNVPASPTNKEDVRASLPSGDEMKQIVYDETRVFFNEKPASGVDSFMVQRFGEQFLHVLQEHNSKLYSELVMKGLTSGLWKAVLLEQEDGAESRNYLGVLLMGEVGSFGVVDPRAEKLIELTGEQMNDAMSERLMQSGLMQEFLRGQLRVDMRSALSTILSMYRKASLVKMKQVGMHARAFSGDLTQVDFSKN